MEDDSGDKQFREQCSSVKCALRIIIQAVNESLANGANQFGDVSTHMQCVFPTLTEIVASIINEYGYSMNGEGVVQFTVTAKKLEKYDKEIESLNSTLTKLLLPLRQ